MKENLINSDIHQVVMLPSEIFLAKRALYITDPSTLSIDFIFCSCS